ncbi:MAG: GDSL-type esterase/lipase family protein [Myxococcota bacterium]
MRNSSRLLIRAGLFAATLAVVVIGMELAGQLHHRVARARWRIAGPQGSPLMEPHPYLVARPKADVRVERGGVVVTLTPAHTRWTGARDDDGERIRIACIGGSTTFGVLVDDEDTWPALLQQQLGDEVAVRNYGVPGYSTAEHVIQLALIVNEWRPHIAVFYVGWNDLRSYHDPFAVPDYYGHGMGQWGVLELVPPGARHLRPALMERSGIVWIAERLRNLAGIEPSEPPLAVNDQARSDPDAEVDRLYRRNLATILSLAKAIDATPVFVPQQMNAAAFVAGTRARPWTPNVLDAAVPALMAHLNGILEASCAAPCVFAAEVAGERYPTEDFVDEGHFGRSGGAKFARALERTLERGALPSARARSERMRSVPVEVGEVDP